MPQSPTELQDKPSQSADNRPSDELVTDSMLSALNYSQFLAKKSASIPPGGLQGPFDLPDSLFPFQKDQVIWALKRGRAALFSSTGLGKTLCQLAWAQEVVKSQNQINAPKVLILAPLAVAKQTVREGQKFGIPVVFVRNQDQVAQYSALGHSIFISNYEMLHQFQPDEFIGVVLDESGIMKNFSGKIRNQLISYFGNTPYRLACTATPAPNDYEELGNHSEFLGILSRTEMLASYFVHDGGETAKWRLKGHAQDIFWKWVCEWAVMVKLPSDLGHSDDGFILPPLLMHEHIVQVGNSFNHNLGVLFAMDARTLNDQRRARRASIDDRVAMAKKIIDADS